MTSKSPISSSRTSSRNCARCFPGMTSPSQARCSCGQAIRTRINLLNQASATNDLTNAYVGQSCDSAQSGNVPQFTPCAQIQSGFPDFYSFAPEIDVDPVFSNASSLTDASLSGEGDEWGCWIICTEVGEHLFSHHPLYR